MVVCCICGNEYAPLLKTLSFHRLPKNAERRKRWVDIIQQKIRNFTCTEHSVICSEHFTLDSFVLTGTGKKYLKSYAKPSLFMTLKKRYNLQDQVEINDHSRCVSIEHSENSTVKIEPVPEEDVEVIPAASHNAVKCLTCFDYAGSVNIQDQMRRKEEDLKRSKEEIVRLRKKVVVFQQKCRRLERKVMSLTCLIKHLQRKYH